MYTYLIESSFLHSPLFSFIYSTSLILSYFLHYSTHLFSSLFFSSLLFSFLFFSSVAVRVHQRLSVGRGNVVCSVLALPHRSTLCCLHSPGLSLSRTQSNLSGGPLLLPPPPPLLHRVFLALLRSKVQIAFHGKPVYIVIVVIF